MSEPANKPDKNKIVDVVERHVRVLDIECVSVGHPFSYTLEDDDEFYIDLDIIEFTTFGRKIRFVFSRRNVLFYSLRDSTAQTAVRSNKGGDASPMRSTEGGMANG